jgi:transcriptional regulator NrdR family protein
LGLGRKSIREAPAAIVKRDGARVVFGRSKIDSAITRAATRRVNSARVMQCASASGSRALAACAGAAVPIEEIQDGVELALRAGHLKTARVHRLSRAALQAAYRPKDNGRRRRVGQ